MDAGGDPAAQAPTPAATGAGAVVAVRAVLDPRGALEPATATGAAAAATAAWVVVDGLGAGPAIVHALDDAGSGVVDVAGVDVGGAQLARVAGRVLDAAAPGARVVLACLANARPAMSGLARALAVGDTVTFACAGSDDDGLAVDDAYVVGALLRMLLEELDAASELDDGAGVAISLTGTYPDDRAGLSAAAAARSLVAAGRSALVDSATARDVAGCVPRLERDGDGDGDGAVVARA